MNGQIKPDERMVWFWQKMTEMYGPAWTSSFGEVPIKIWVNALAEVSIVSLKAGLARCLDRKDRFGKPDRFPPNLPEFVALCRDVVRAMCHRQYVALPKPVVDKAIAIASLGEIRAVVGHG